MSCFVRIYFYCKEAEQNKLVVSGGLSFCVISGYWNFGLLRFRRRHWHESEILTLSPFRYRSGLYCLSQRFPKCGAHHPWGGVIFWGARVICIKNIINEILRNVFKILRLVGVV
jgi:hypothetical protein